MPVFNEIVTIERLIDKQINKKARLSALVVVQKD
jgi:hypothetical protein